MKSNLFVIMFKKESYSKLLKINNLLTFLVLFFVVNLTAQIDDKAQEDFFNSNFVYVAKGQKKSIKPADSSRERRNKDLDADVFYASESICIGKGGILTINTRRVRLETGILGLGKLQFSAIDTISVITKNAIEVAHVSVVNTVLSLESTLKIEGKLVLDNAAIQLNNADLFTAQTVVFLNDAKIIINKSGVWVSKTQYERPLLPVSGENTLAKLMITSPMVDYVVEIAKISEKETNNTFFVSSFYDEAMLKNQKPPPKYNVYKTLSQRHAEFD